MALRSYPPRQITATEPIRSKPDLTKPIPYASPDSNPAAFLLPHVAEFT
jgi:hypothetical protein